MQKEITLDPNEGWYVPAQETNKDTGTTVLYDVNGDPVDVVTSPEGLKAEAIAAPKAPSRVTQTTSQARGAGTRLKDSFKEGLTYGFPGLAARKLNDWFDTGKEELRKRNPNLNEDELEQLQEKVVNAVQMDMRKDFTEKRRQDPTWRPDEGWVDNIVSGRWIPFLGGQLAAASGDPANFIAPGASAGVRIGAQGAINVGAETAYQGLEIADGMRETLSPSEAVEAGAVAMLFQGNIEAGRWVVDFFKKAKSAGQVPEDVSVRDVMNEAAAMQDAAQRTEQLQEAFDNGMTAEELFQYATDNGLPIPNAEDLRAAIEARDSGIEGIKVLPPENPREVSTPATVDAEGNIVPMQAANDIEPNIETFQVRKPTDEQVDTMLDNLDEARAQEPRPAREAGEEALYDGNINLDRFKTAKNVQNEWETVVGEINKMLPERTVQSQEATKSLARRLGVDVAELLKKNPTLEEAPQVAVALENMLLEANKRIVTKAQNRANWTDADRDEFIEDIMLAAFIQEKATKMRTETGRALNAYNIVRRGGPKYRRTIEELNPMFKKENADRLADMILAHPDKADKIARDAMGKRAEDYLFSFMYNMMLSNPATHTVNFVGTGSHVGLDLVSKGVASLIGQFKRPLKGADRVYGREVLARMTGIINGFLDWNNYKKAGQSYIEGVPVDRIAEVEVSDPVLPKPASMVLGYPTRLLAASDELWRGIIQSSSFYGEATRMAIKEGLKGDALKARVNELVANPTENMKDKAIDYARQMQFLDDSSPLARGIQYLKQKKAIENPVQDAVVRTGQTLLRMIVPFDRTPDALIRSALRNSPLGLVDRYNLEGLWKGGASRDEAVARMMVGTGLTYSLIEMVNDGLITGSGPEDYEKRVKMEDTGWQANSVWIPGQGYVSYEGLEPLSIIFNVVSSLTEQSNDEERADKDIDDQVAGMIADLGTALSNNTFTESIGNFLQMFSDGPQGESARNNFVAGLASTLTTPAIVRNYNQTQNDEAVRVTTGDGSLTDRVTGRVAAGWPGASEQLPQRHDAYGRPMEQKERLGPDMFTRAKVTPEETDPTVLEIDRIGGLARVDKGDIKEFKADAEQVQAYQKLSGEYIAETVRQMMESGEWGALTDEEKKKELKSIIKDMREIARETLFPDYYGEEAEIELDPSEGWSTEPQ